MIFGGPDKATVKGTLDGAAVDATFTRSNGCEIARWDRMTALKILPAGASSGPWPAGMHPRGATVPPPAAVGSPRARCPTEIAGAAASGAPPARRGGCSWCSPWWAARR